MSRKMRKRSLNLRFFLTSSCFCAMRNQFLRKGSLGFGFSSVLLVSWFSLQSCLTLSQMMCSYISFSWIWPSSSFYISLTSLPFHICACVYSSSSSWMMTSLMILVHACHFSNPCNMNPLSHRRSLGWVHCPMTGLSAKSPVLSRLRWETKCNPTFLWNLMDLRNCWSCSCCVGNCVSPLFPRLI